MRLHRIALSVVGGLGVMGMLAGAVTAGTTALPVGNLVKNSGGEVPRGAAFPTQNVAPAGWTKGDDTDGSGIQLVRYGPNTTLTSAVPSKAVSTGLGGGASYFVGGYPSKVSTAFQVIDLAAAAADIAAGGVTACLSGYLGGAKQDTGTALVDLEFLGEGDASLGRLRIGPVTRGQRQSQTTLLRRAAQKPVPNGTLQLRVVLRAQAGRDSANNLGPNSGSADNISVALVKGGACDPALTVKCVKQALVATVTPSPVAPTQRVRFSVKGGQKTKLAVAKSTSRFTMDGLTGRLTVTAAVAQKGGGTITLTKTSRRC
jgi:hypothetical protein